MDRAKINVIEQLPPPTNVKGVRSFLGHAGFYRRFIKDFSHIARPLTNLLAKDAPFNFDEECLMAFYTLKKALVTAPIIQPPDYNLPFKIMCDTSGVKLLEHRIMCECGVYHCFIVKHFQCNIRGIFVIIENYKSLVAKSF